MKFTFSFIGRQAGASGIIYKIVERYECSTISEAKSLLWEDYDIVHNLKIEGCSYEDYNAAPFIKVRSYRTRKTSPLTHLYLDSKDLRL